MPVLWGLRVRGKTLCFRKLKNYTFLTVYFSRLTDSDPWELFYSCVKYFLSIDNKYILSDGGSVDFPSWPWEKKFLSVTLFHNFVLLWLLLEWLTTSIWCLHCELSKIFNMFNYVCMGFIITIKIFFNKVHMCKNN